MAGYIRQDTTNNIADGNVINASDFDNEYNAIEAAFNATTGHTHDGTSAEGAAITKIGPTQDVVASATALTPKTDNTVDLGSSALEYKDLYIDGTANIDSLVADTADINAGTIDGVTIGGASAGAATFTTVGATTGNITTVNATTVDTTNIEVSNVKAKDGTASITLADSTGVASFSAAPVLSALTASQAVFTDASKNLVSNAITGTGNVVMSTSPTLVTPVLGAATATSLNGLTVSSTTGTLTLANGSTLATSGANALTLTTTGATNVTLPTSGTLATTAGTVASFSAGTTGFTPSTATTGAVTLAGTLATTNGGTGLTSFTSGGVVYASSTSALATGSALTFDGTGQLSSNRSTNGVGFSTTNGSDADFLINMTSGVTRLSPTTGILAFGVNSTEQMRLTSTGLGIGTSSPGQKLSVNGDTLIGTNLFIGNGAGSMVGATAPSLYSPASGTLGISTAGVERMRLDSSGNLGIGTSSPQGSLDVTATGVTVNQFLTGGAGNNLVTGIFRIGSGLGRGASIQGFRGASSNVHSLDFYTYNSADVFGMRLDSSGNLGIGTSSPSVRLMLEQAANSAPVTLLRLNNSGTTGGGPGIASRISFTAGATALGFIQGSNFASGAAGLQLSGDGTNAQATLDSSGNLGLGVTPSAWGSTFRTLQLPGGSSISGTTDPTLQITQNGFYNGTNWIYSTTAPVSNYYQASGQHVWRIAPSGTAGNAISFTQAMTLDASGNLAVGKTSASYRVDIAGAYQTDSGYYINGNTSGGFVWVRDNYALRFGTNDTERARITSGGYSKFSNNGTYANSASYHEFYQTNNSDTLRLTSTSTAVSGAYGLYVDLTVDPNATDSFFVRCFGGATQRASIRSNGGLANYSGNDVNLSDRREKTNFAPAKSYLDTICAIPVQTFNYIDQNLEEDPGLTLGVVAQDVQAVAPELVMESNWGTAEEPKQRLSIYQTDLQYALMKCVQELKAELDSVKAELATLKGQP